MTDQAKRKVLDMVEQGQISPDEGLQLINALAGSDKDQASESSNLQGEVAYIPQSEGNKSTPPISDDDMERMKKMKRWWILPFAIGLLLTVSAAIWMYSGYLANGFGWGFWLSWLPFLIGIAMVAISFPTSKSIWLHVRIKQKPGDTPQRINISMPMPLQLVRWGFNSFGDKIPDLKENGVGDISEILGNLSPDQPFYVHVEDDDGEDVEVFIG